VGLELAHVQGVMQLYCRALSGTPIEVLAAPGAGQQRPGQGNGAGATTDGGRIFLPAHVDRYATWDDNFAWLKVAATHQVAHLEFGSFALTFETPAVLFANRRFEPDAAFGPQQMPHARHTTAMGRWLRLFAQRRLALDLFTILEDCRLDARLTVAYPGVQQALREAQAEALARRPRLDGLPLKEVLVELLLRMSLEAFTALVVPQDYADVALMLARILHPLRTMPATVQDTAEATLRAYTLIAAMPNVLPATAQWQPMELDTPGGFSEAAYDALLGQWSATPAVAAAQAARQVYGGLPPVDYRGDFQPALVQFFASLRHDQFPRVLSQELLEQAQQEGVELVWEADYDALATGIPLLMQHAQEGGEEAPGSGSFTASQQADNAAESLQASEVRTYVYDEWDCGDMAYKPDWCLVRETVLAEGGLSFYNDTLRQYGALRTALKRQFERLLPARWRRVYRLAEGEDLDLNAALEAWADLRMHVPPDEKIYWRRQTLQRHVAVALLLDMSASTAEPLDMEQPTARRLIDLEKESLVLLIEVLEMLGDTYGMYGFSGYGRDKVEFYVIKDLDERLGDRIKRRLDTIAPAHATRMGAAIRHTITKLASQDAPTRLLFLLSDGRPQDRDYRRPGLDKEYAIHDTRMALLEAQRQRITPFCLTVDTAGYDYMQAMCAGIRYEVLDTLAALPSRLSMLYRSLTS
jgi:nitric oxide reductase NorD protein